MAAIITLGGGLVNATGQQITLVIGSGAVPYSPSSGITGITISAAGSNVPIASSSISSTTLTLILAGTILSGQICTLTIVTGSNLTDSLANTALGQSNLALTNTSMAISQTGKIPSIPSSPSV